MVVHYPGTVWKNSYAEHEVTGKTYNFLKKRQKKDVITERDVGWGGVKNQVCMTNNDEGFMKTHDKWRGEGGGGGVENVPWTTPTLPLRA